MASNEPLDAAIDSLIETLLSVDNDNTISMDNAQQLIGEHREKISAVLVTYSQGDYSCYPIHRLLSAKPLSRVEIPLDILEMLTSFGFDINEISWIGNCSSPCVTVAIRNRHYAAVRWLVGNGADCNLRGKDIYKYPITWLASYPNEPLDLFDILKTSENLNGTELKDSPLHTTARHGHTESALHLIKLGANVMQPATNMRFTYNSLPIDYYIKNYARSYHVELFTSLMPSCNKKLFCIICAFLIETKGVLNFDVVFRMLQNLLQHLILDQPVSLMIHREFESNSDSDSESESECDFSNEYYGIVKVKLNQDDVYKKFFSCKDIYLLSLLFLHLDCDVAISQEALPPFLQNHPSFNKTMALAQAVDDIWKKCRSRQDARSLLRMCIEQTRQSMNSLSDSSFLTLPVPSSIRKMLMYQDIAEVICKAWRLWPQLLPMDNYT